MKRNLFILVILVVIAVVAIFVAKGSLENEPVERAPVEEVVETGEMEEASEAESLEERDGEVVFYNLDTGTSTLSWSAARLVGGGHVGTVALSQGRLIEIAGELEEGVFVIDMTTITESRNSEGFLRHVRSDDFFDVETYPTSQLKVTSLEAQGDGAYVVTGDLTILDQTHEIRFPATITTTEQGLEAQAVFDIDRTRWGVVFDSGSVFTNLGERAIKDEISYTLDLTFSR